MRYDRNISVWGEHQEKIASAHVAVVGGGLAGQYVLACLSSLGLGEISGFVSGRCDAIVRSTSETPESWCEAHAHLNSGVQYNFFSGQPFVAAMEVLQPDFVVHTQPEEKVTLDFLVEHCSCPVLSLNIGTHALHISSSKRIRDASGDPQAHVAGVGAALVVEEIRKRLFTYTDDEHVATDLSYSTHRSGRTSGRHRFCKDISLDDKRALVVGAGGIGTYVALALAQEGVKYMDIVDEDVIEEHNLNRQCLFYDQVGDHKASVLADRLIRHCPHVGAQIARVGSSDYAWMRPLCERDGIDEATLATYAEGVFPSSNYDVIFGCVDNKYTRLFLDRFCKEHDIVYVDGGCGPRSGQVAVYVPGGPTVDEQLDLGRMPPPIQQIEGCAEVAEGNIVMSNMLIGSAMVGEWKQALAGKALEAPLCYDVFAPRRLYIEPVRARFAEQM